MSRHKLVKNMDLDDEMDDYDGGEEYADDGAAEGMLPFFTGCLKYWRGYKRGIREGYANIMVCRAQ